MNLYQRSCLGIFFLSLAVLIGCQKEEPKSMMTLNLAPTPPIKTDTPSPIRETPIADYNLKALAKPAVVLPNGQSTDVVTYKTVGTHWSPLAQLDVQMAPDRTVVMESALLIGNKPNGNFTCEFTTDNIRWVPGKKWAPLPINIVKKKDPKVAIPDFERRLDFPFKEVKKDEFTFLTDFKSGEQIFRSLWKAIARPAIENGKPVCKAVMQICLKPEGTPAAPQCTRKWQSLHFLMAVFSVDLKDFGTLKEVKLKLKDIDVEGFPIGDLVELNYTDFIKP